MAVLMKDGNHFHAGLSNGEIHGVGESLEQTTPDSRLNFRKLKRIDPDTRQDVIELIKKANPETCSLVLVPDRSVADIKLGLPLEKEVSHRPGDFGRLNWSRISCWTSSQARPSEGRASWSAMRWRIT